MNIVDRNLNDLQAVVKRVVYIEVKTAWQALLLMWKSDAHYPYGQRHLKNEEFKNQKNSKVKKNYLSANSNGENRNGGQSG